MLTEILGFFYSDGYSKEKDKKLAELIVEGNTKEAIKLIDEIGSSVIKKDPYNSCFISLAASNGYEEIALKLLEFGAPINKKDDLSFIHPIGFACSNAMPKLMLKLIERGADTDFKDSKGYGLLHYAASFGSIELVQKLIKLGLDINDQSKSKDTPLHVACLNNKIEIVYQLLIAGADFSSLDDKDNPAFSYAPSDLQIRILMMPISEKFIEALFEIDCDIIKIDKTELYAKIFDVDEIIDLHKKGIINLKEMLFECAKYSLSEALKAFIKLFPEENIFRPDSDGKTILHYIQNLEILKIVVSEGKKYDIIGEELLRKDNEGNDALSHLSYFPPLIKYLNESVVFTSEMEAVLEGFCVEVVVDDDASSNVSSIFGILGSVSDVVTGLLTQ